MNTDSISYVLIVAVTGMVIVFIFLAFLSVLMPLIRRVLGDQDPGAGAAQGSVSERGESGRGAGGGDTPLWVYAAAAAFLQAEERGAASSTVWVSTRSTGYDPWTAGGLSGRSEQTRNAV